MVLTEKPRTTDILRAGNGRFIPTFLGMNHTQDSIDKIKKALANKPKSREQVRGMSTVWEVVRPLLLRGGLPIEIAQMSGFTHEQVRNAIYRKRPDDYSVPRDLFTKEKETERKRKAAKPGQPKKLFWYVSEDRRKNIEFARRLYSDGSIDTDLTVWNALRVIYSQNGRELPDDFAYRLILERLLAVLVKANLGDSTDLERFIEVGKDVGVRIFGNTRLNSDRRYIERTVFKR